MKTSWKPAAALTLLVAVTIFFAPCARGGGVAPPRATPVGKPTMDKKTLDLAREYRELRKGKGHFSGGAWSPELDGAGGRKHSVMVEIGNALGNPSYSRDEIVGLLGAPDAERKQNAEEHIIYFWRGWHDYLYFICEDGTIRGHRWHHAYE